MDTGHEDPDDSARATTAALRYRLCPRCLRAVPGTSGERYCVNDGTRLLDSCPACGAAITSPYARHCSRCGHTLGDPPETSPTH
ncbi:zinc ribbon domain-containing protein [Deinococcus sp.]|uniref:zinc ribbon domain-containing protein n=1 Tax=Deinococcus sp. TaxID=47478 RepID=UPI0028698B74|nr:zinc ribbon domain-containing protein [Deinococcus sp.]